MAEGDHGRTLGLTGREILIGALASAVYAVAEAVVFSVYHSLPVSFQRGHFLKAQVPLPVWVLVGSHVFLVVTALAVVRRRQIVARRGRHTAILQNLDLIRKRHAVTAERSLICSTRFSDWPPSEVSEDRRSFREELEKAIRHEGREVRRIWAIRDGHDAARLDEIVNRYQGQQNHSIRVFLGLPAYLLPELLIVNDRDASMSFPQLRSPFGIDASLTFWDRQAVQVTRQYFEILWGYATPVFETGQAVEANMQLARQYPR